MELANFGAVQIPFLSGIDKICHRSLLVYLPPYSIQYSMMMQIALLWCNSNVLTFVTVANYNGS